jgi:hypothetical protein
MRGLHLHERVGIGTKGLRQSGGHIWREPCLPIQEIGKGRPANA